MPSYHMRRAEKEITEKSELNNILMNGKFIMLAFCRADEPYIATLNYGYDAEKNALYFHCAQEGLKLDFIRRNPRVCATVVEDHGYKMNACDHAYRSLVLRGTMHRVEDLDEKKHALEILLHHLEEDPAAVRARTLKEDKAVQNVGILRMDIGEMSGKASL